MKSELLARSPMLILPLMALFLFVGLFVAIFVITMTKRAESLDPLARLPLEDDADTRDEGAV